MWSSEKIFSGGLTFYLFFVILLYVLLALLNSNSLKRLWYLAKWMYEGVGTHLDGLKDAYGTGQVIKSTTSSKCWIQDLRLRYQVVSNQSVHSFRSKSLEKTPLFHWSSHRVKDTTDPECTYQMNPNWNHNNKPTMETKNWHFIRTWCPLTVNTVTFPQLPGINVRFAEVSDPAGVKLLICLHLTMGVTSGGQWSWKKWGRNSFFILKYLLY